MRISLILGAISALIAAEPAAGQSWRAALGYQHDAFLSDHTEWEDWTRVTGSLTREFQRGALTVEASHHERFGEDELAAAADLYHTLWPGAYANVRAGIAPDAVTLAKADVYGELFQTIGRGWEVSGNYRYMQFEPEAVHAFGGGVGYFIGNAYLRARATLTRQAGTTGSAFAIAARYGSHRTQFLEAVFGTGREVTVLSPGPVTALRSTDYAVLRGSRFWGEHFGTSATLGATRFAEIPDRAIIGVDLLWRW